MPVSSAIRSVILFCLLTFLPFSQSWAGDTISLASNNHPLAIESLEEQLKPGSLIFHEGCCLAVKVYTQSPYTHVGILLPDNNGTWWVYDSASGDGVRRLTLNSYLQDSAPESVTFCHPINPLQASQQAKLKKELERLQGRPYGIRHFLTGSEADGLHCSEYVTRCLMTIDVLHANRPSRVSPASLLAGIQEAELYEHGSEVEIARILEPVPEPEGWCARWWAETKACTTACCRSWNRFILCRD